MQWGMRELNRRKSPGLMGTATPKVGKQKYITTSSRTREILVSVTFHSHSSLFVYFTFRLFLIAHEELQRTTKKKHAPFPTPLSFFVLTGPDQSRTSSGSTRIDDLTMTRWRKFDIGEKHHNE
jgi:hypothetical protein